MEHENQQPASRRPQKKSRSRGGSVVRMIFKIIGKTIFALFTVLLIGVCTAGMVGGIFLKYIETNVMPNVSVNADDYTMALSSFIYYHDDEVEENDGWVEYQTIHGNINRIWISLDEMPEEMWQAAVAIEDHRFFEHQGVDWRRTGGAVLNMFIGMRDTFGGSTITQQMLKNMTEDNDPTVNRKVREIFRALDFEENNTKWQILELYLNTIFFGQGCYGVQTAAQVYFGKDAKDLTAAECACLIAITNNPSMYGPFYDIEITMRNDDGSVKEVVTPRELNKRRQETILLRMAGGNEEVGVTGLDYLTMEEAEKACDELLRFTDGSTSAEDVVARATGGVKVNNWFVEQVYRDVTSDLAEELKISKGEAEQRILNSGYKIYTTMDLELQEMAEAVYRDRENLDNLTSRDGQPIQSGITILDPYTGDIKALVGAMGEKEGNLVDSYATMKKQVGSSIKPLTAYAPAIDAGVVTPATSFDDYPVRELNGTHWPKNSPNRYRGFVQVDTGVQLSINTIALQTLQTVGTAEAFAFATEKLSLDLVAEDMDESPLAMGGLTHGLSTVEMAAAYAAFANKGVYNEPRTYLKVEDAEGNVVLDNTGESHVAMKETTAHLMNQLLKNAVSYGTGTQAKFSGMTIAGKTGTTDDNFTRYFVGYTPYYVAAVWTGYKYNARISYDGGNPAITMWKKIMEPLHAELENKDFTKPETGLTSVAVCVDSGLLPTDACRVDIRGDRVKSKTIASGTAPTDPCTYHVMRDYCMDGQCLATEYCPVESVVQRGVLDYVRADYGAKVVAEDNAYLLSSLEKAIGLQPTIAEDGTEVYPEVIGCPVHTTALPFNPTDFPFMDPSHPDYNPMLDPNSPEYDPSLGFGDANFVDPMDPIDPSNPVPPLNPVDPNTPTTPTDPVVPTDPVNPNTPADPITPTDPSTPSGTTDPSGGGTTGDDWWNDFWDEAAV